MYVPHIVRMTIATILCLLSIEAIADDGKQQRRQTAQSRVREIEQKITAASDRTRQSIVRIAWGKEEREGGCSGVIVDAKGHVATSGRQLLNAGSPVIFYLADGRRATGKVLGASWALGVGLMMLDGEGPWPHASLGKSKELGLGSLCLALGYPSLHQGGGLPQHEQQPLPRLGQVTLAAAAPVWLRTSCQLSPSDCGGGLFNLEGELIGIHIAHRLVSGNSAEVVALHAGIEVLAENWEALVAGNTPGSHFDAAAGNSPDGAIPTDLTEGEKTRVARPTYKARSASVGLQWGPGERDGCSGTIISTDGYIATCEHHERPCGELVTVHLSDGRSVAGRVLCSDPVLDIGLMKITEAGPWPHVERAKSSELKPGEACISLGYPVHRPDGRGPRWREPFVRVGRILNTSISPARFAASGTLYGGDSGGGLFDADGRLVGIHIGGGVVGGPDMVWRAGCELIESRWRFLAAQKPFDVLPPIGLGDTAELLERAIGELPAITVEVLSGKKRCCFGTIVGANGWVLTKASELGDTVTCRLADGTVASAKVHAMNVAHDLAMLKLDAENLPTIEWSDDQPPTPGAMIAAVGFNSRSAVGMVSQTVHAVLRQSGWLFIGGLRDGNGGVEVVDNSAAVANGDAIGKGDAIVALQGQPTPDVKTYLSLTEKPGIGVVPVFAGDPIRVAIRRDGKTFELRVRVRPEVNTAGHSMRRSGFAEVFDTDAHVLADQCGGPVVNKSGKIVGIVIAHNGNERTHVLPANTVQKVVEQLRAEYRTSP